MKSMVTVFLALVTSGTQAATQTVNCGHLLDVKAGAWRNNVSVVIEDGKVKSVAPMLPAAGHVDLSAQWCLPGLIDTHVHLTSETSREVDALRNALTENPADAAFRAVNMAKRTLLAGFTTVRDLGTDAAGLNVSLKRAIDSGAVMGPRMFTSGTAIATTGGHADPTNSLSHRLSRALGEPGPTDGVVNSAEEARQAVRARYKEGADLIKITATGGVLSQARSGQNSQFSEDELRAVVVTARDYGFRVAAHAHGAEGMKRAISAGVDSIEHGTLLDEQAIALFKKHGTWLVPTLSAGRFSAEKAKESDYFSPLVRPKVIAMAAQSQAAFARAYKSGVKVAFGSDAGVFPHGENAKEFAYMVEAGVPALEAIRSATLHAATLLDESKSLGSIEAGYAADMVAVNGDPLGDITLLQKLTFVMKNGVVYKKP